MFVLICNRLSKKIRNLHNAKKKKKKFKKRQQNRKTIDYFSCAINSDLMSRMFANDPGDWSSIPGRVIPKTLKMVLDAALIIM